MSWSGQSIQLSPCPVFSHLSTPVSLDKPSLSAELSLDTQPHSSCKEHIAQGFPNHHLPPAHPGVVSSICSGTAATPCPFPPAGVSCTLTPAFPLGECCWAELSCRTLLCCNVLTNSRTDSQLCRGKGGLSLVTAGQVQVLFLCLLLFLILTQINVIPSTEASAIPSASVMCLKP